MDFISVFTENLRSAALMLGRNEGGAILYLPSGAIAAASGYPAAGENYLLLTPDTSENEVAEMLFFFKERQLSFVAPILPGSNAGAIFALEQNGIGEKITYTAMTLDLTHFERARGEDNLIHAASPEEVGTWGQTVWEGFGGKDGIDEAYAVLVRHMSAQRSNDLYALCNGADAVACGLLHHDEKKNCGLYYFATKPAFRRKGYARRLMAGLVQEAALGFGALVLLATPIGQPFYKEFGFTTLTSVPIHSAATDI